MVLGNIDTVNNLECLKHRFQWTVCSEVSSLLHSDNMNIQKSYFESNSLKLFEILTNFGVTLYDLTTLGMTIIIFVAKCVSR